MTNVNFSQTESKVVPLSIEIEIPTTGKTPSGQVIPAGTPGLVNTQQENGWERNKKPFLPITNNSEVFLRFRVDGASHQITVFVIDRVSKRVLRSIPPEELDKLKAGDLLELFA